MNSNLTPLDISNRPDILKLAEEVQKTNTPRVLTRDQQSIAVVMPLTPGDPHGQVDIWKGYDATRVREALAQSAGTLADVDIEALKRDIAQARAQHEPRHSR